MRYGKFDSAKAMLNAYLELEKEFTRKSQENAQLRLKASKVMGSVSKDEDYKQRVEQKQDNSQSDYADNVTTAKMQAKEEAINAEIGQNSTNAEMQMKEEVEENRILQNSTKFGKEELQNAQFEQKNTQDNSSQLNEVGSVTYVDKVCNTPTTNTDKEQLNSDNPKGNAYNLINYSAQCQNQHSPNGNYTAEQITEELCNKLSDQNFVEKYILTNSKLTEIILRETMDKYARNSAPTIISTGNNFVSCPQNKPKTLEQAKKLIKHFIG